jgi:heme/copper-type cytochrome/quinol oxidase subunit 3
MASLAIRYDRGLRKVMLWLLVTLALGVVFLALEAREFTYVLAEGAVPQRSGFLSAFFSLVPLHGTHVTAGVIWLVMMLIQLDRTGLTGLQFAHRPAWLCAAPSMASISSWLARALKLRAMFLNTVERFGEIPASLALAS